MEEIKKTTVLVTHITHETAQKAFKRSIDRFASNFDEYPVKTICIKVNLCDYRMAESGATTDPVLLEFLTKVLQERFKPESISVIENNATAIEADSLFSLLGFRNVADRNKLRLINAAEEEWLRKPVANAQVFHELEVPKIWEEAGLRVNFTKLKTNSLTKTTGCLKNMFGLLREKRKSVYHPVIDKVISDINLAMKSDLCIVDGLIGQEGVGPAFGIPKRCELLIAGIDPVAVDACCARIMGFNPHFVGHIMNCYKHGIGNKEYILETDIPNFDFNNYKFKYSRIEHLIRTIIRKFFHVGAAG